MGSFMVLADESIDSIAINDNDYQPGIGRFVGKVTRVSGKVIIVHLNETSGYQAFQNMNVYRGDTIFTGINANVIICLNDGSQISQGAVAQIQLNQIVYTPKNRRRDAFIHMSSGKARFSVQKLKNYKNSRFRIKTVSALIGVRGSDFVIQVKPELTEVAAFENTELALIGLDMPDLSPVILHPFEKSDILLGKPPTSPSPLSIEEMDGLKNEFMLDRQAMKGPETKENAPELKKKNPIRISQTVSKNTSAQQLAVNPSALKPPLNDFSNNFKQFENETLDNNTHILEQKHEIATELPAFPVFP